MDGLDDGSGAVRQEEERKQETGFNKLLKKGHKDDWCDVEEANNRL